MLFNAKTLPWLAQPYAVVLPPWASLQGWWLVGWATASTPPAQQSWYNRQGQAFNGQTLPVPQTDALSWWQQASQASPPPTGQWRNLSGEPCTNTPPLTQPSFALWQYEWGYLCDPALASDPLPAPTTPLPQALWVSLPYVLAYHPQRHTTILWQSDVAPPLPLDTLAEMATGLQGLAYDTPHTTTPQNALSRSDLEGWLAPQGLGKAGFVQAAFATLAAIAQGEFYQANVSVLLSQRLALPHPLGAWAWWWVAYQANPSPFAAYWHTPQGAVVCNSPERLLHVTPQGVATTNPIAGTRRRGATPEADAQRATELSTNPKELAEHAMLVDLLRNDLGKVCQVGSVTVADYASIETYRHVMHLVSKVTGQLNASTHPWEALAAVYPGGTITGCPKVRCMQWLRQCEPHARGVYTGSLGWVDAATGAMDMNILIRTGWAEPQADTATTQASWQVGAGLVADSLPQAEFEECLGKGMTLGQSLPTRLAFALS
jgi:anthranilate/para-aminobenzoate synthase component I